MLVHRRPSLAHRSGGVKSGVKNSEWPNSHKQLEALTAADDGKTLREDGGLVGKVRSGKRGLSVLFRYEYKFENKKKFI